MKHPVFRIVLVSLCALIVLGATLFSCASSLKSEVYATIETIDVSGYTAEAIMAPNYKTPAQHVARSPKDYQRLATYGEEGARYILKYVIDTPAQDYLNAMFLTSCAYEILGSHEFPDIDIHDATGLAKALYEEIK